MKKQKLTKISDFAKRKEVTVQAIYKQINKGKLKTIKKFGLILIVE